MLWGRASPLGGQGSGQRRQDSNPQSPAAEAECFSGGHCWKKVLLAGARWESPGSRELRVLANTHVAGFPPNGPPQTGSRSSCCVQRAWKGPKVGGLRVGHKSSVAPATPDNSFVNRTGPGGGRQSGAPHSPRMGVAWQNPTSLRSQKPV